MIACAAVIVIILGWLAVKKLKEFGFFDDDETDKKDRKSDENSISTKEP